VYGLGNFCFDGNRNGGSITWHEGYLLVIDFGTQMPKIELIPFVQCKDSATVALMQEMQVVTFDQAISKLNSIIADDAQLQQSFEGWISRNNAYVTSLFSSWHNRYLNAAANRGWIPYLTSRKEYGAMLNRICCEAHRDITIAVLNEKMCHK
jgi:hypothetical protein